MDEEIWKTTRTLPEFLVSSWGRVMRVPYFSEMPKGGQRLYGGKPHYGVRDDVGRMKFSWGGNNYRISRLVCEAFHGPAPFPGAVAMHIDDNPANNRPENVRWGSQRENLNAPAFIEYCRSRTGDDNPYIKGRRQQEAD